MPNPLRRFSTRLTAQSDPIRGSDQVANSAGGHAWAVDDWSRLRRFLILGVDGGSYYATEHQLVKENADAVLRCLAVDGARTVMQRTQPEGVRSGPGDLDRTLDAHLRVWERSMRPRAT